MCFYIIFRPLKAFDTIQKLHKTAKQQQRNWDFMNKTEVKI